MTRKQIVSLILLAASVAYDFIPVDFIPDIPFIGWIDDTLITSSALLNCVQQFCGVDDSFVQRVLKYTKWIVFVIAILLILAIGSVIGIIASFFQ